MTMTVKEFKEWLEQFPEDATVQVVVDGSDTAFKAEEFDDYCFVDYTTNPLTKENHPFFGKKVLFLGSE